MGALMISSSLLILITLAGYRLQGASMEFFVEASN
jgi:hypothetical protein